MDVRAMVVVRPRRLNPTFGERQTRGDCVVRVRMYSSDGRVSHSATVAPRGDKACRRLHRNVRATYRRWPCQYLVYEQGDNSPGLIRGLLKLYA